MVESDLIFLFDLILGLRQKSFKKIVGFLGDLKTPKGHFENNWPLGNISFKVTDDILASQNAKVAIEENSNVKNVANLQETQVMNDDSKGPLIYYVSMLFLAFFNLLNI